MYHCIWMHARSAFKQSSIYFFRVHSYCSEQSNKVLHIVWRTHLKHYKAYEYQIKCVHIFCYLFILFDLWCCISNLECFFSLYFIVHSVLCDYGILNWTHPFCSGKSYNIYIYHFTFKLHSPGALILILNHLGWVFLYENLLVWILFYVSISISNLCSYNYYFP